MSRSSDFVRLMLMARLSSMKKTAICPRSLPRALFESQQFIYDAFVGAKANRVAKESGDSAKLAAIRTAASGFQRHDVKRSPAGAEFGHERTQHFRYQTELVEVESSPREWTDRVAGLACDRRPSHRAPAGKLP